MAFLTGMRKPLQNFEVVNFAVIEPFIRRKPVEEDERIKKTNFKPVESLVQALVRSQSPSEKDKRIIGALLQVMHETEEILDDAIVGWLLPFYEDNGRTSVSGYLVGRTSLIDKAEFGKRIGLLNGEQVEMIKTLNRTRNGLAHRRPEEEKPHNIFNEEKQTKFISDAKIIQSHIKENRVEVQIQNALMIQKAYFNFKKQLMSAPPTKRDISGRSENRKS